MGKKLEGPEYVSAHTDEISDQVKNYIEEKGDQLPAGIRMAYARDDARLLRSRLDLLLRNLSGDRELAIKSIEALIHALPTVSPSGKAGAYAIQGAAAAFVPKIIGSYSNVVGLPLAETAALLRGLGIEGGQAGKTPRAG